MTPPAFPGTEERDAPGPRPGDLALLTGAGPGGGPGDLGDGDAERGGASSPVGPGWDDEQLTAWVQAASDGGLPEPGRERWQPLRAGIVNLWEYGADEYWFADGRAQLSGANQSGKSTLMALTTLILLTGDLDRRNLDTFGKDQKSFRYYLEPTGRDDDRRPATGGANRGWAWMEYGRLTAAGPQYFTCLLFAQANRASQTMKRVWLTAVGPRVRDGLRLHEGAAVATAGDVADVAGVRVHSSGRDYVDRIAKDLFGYTDADRLSTLAAMLRVLRQPHLGQQLNPDYFTAQMRQALPEVDPAEVAQLADGWEQLDRLAEDRDSAEQARDAVAAFVRTAYNPWADSVLRARADTLAAAETAIDNVTRDVRDAETRLESAQLQLADLERRVQDAEQARDAAATAHTTLAESTAVSDARARASRVEELARSLKAAQALVEDRGREKARAGEQERRAAERLRAAQVAATEAKAKFDALLTPMQSALAVLGLPDAARGWLAGGEIDRAQAAARERAGLITRLRALMEVQNRATRELGAAQDADDAARAAEQQARADADAAGAGWDQAAQELSDDMERWATGVARQLANLTSGSDASTGSGSGFSADPDRVAPTAPAAELLRAWVQDTLDAAAAGQRSARLHRAIETGWVTPSLTPIRAAVAAHQAAAATAAREAGRLDAEADKVEAERDTRPAEPTLWTRRERPAGSDTGAGAPLWRLLDPVDTDHLDVVEAALAASGLLDTWVTPDGAWLPDRDGDDVVLSIPGTTHEGPAGNGSALASLCRVADDAGVLTHAVQAVLAAVHVVDAGQPLPAAGSVPLTFSLDGRWRTAYTEGRAAPAAHGATLIGTAARAAARARRVAELRRQAQDLRDRAAVSTANVKANAAIAALVEQVPASAPTGEAVIDAAAAVRAADEASNRAEAAAARATTALTKATAAAADAETAVIEHANLHRLPVALAQVDDLAGRLDGFRDALASLSAAFYSARGLNDAVRAATEQHEEAEEGLVDAVEAHTRAEQQERRAHTAHQTAQEGMTGDDKELLAKVEQLRVDKDAAFAAWQALSGKTRPLAVEAALAGEALGSAGARREQADLARQAALAAFLVPVRAGLAAGRGLPDLTDERITAALVLAREIRSRLHPAGWPEEPAARARRVDLAWTRVTTRVTEARALLEAAGGRTLEVDLTASLDGDADRAADAAAGTAGPAAGASDDVLPSVRVTVDAGGAPLTPWQAQQRLTEQVEELSNAHDSKLGEVLTELLSSTFVNHLRDRARKVDDLLHEINRVLRDHPTGANRAVLKLRKQAPEGHKDAFDVIEALTAKFLDDPGVQAQIRDFLHGQVRLAQEAARAHGDDWKERLAQLLDYRAWVDVVVDKRVEGGAWRPLTRAAHDVDSGGGKAVTLLQPLLATLVALYDDADCAPRPVWLDEAFAGIDDANRAQVLDLFSQFDLDFLFAGPGTLVATAAVPAVAIWAVNRAPAPLPGVDLSLTLWTGADRTARAIETDFSETSTSIARGGSRAGRPVGSGRPGWTDGAGPQGSLFDQDDWEQADGAPSAASAGDRDAVHELEGSTDAADRDDSA